MRIRVASTCSLSNGHARAWLAIVDLERTKCAGSHTHRGLSMKGCVQHIEGLVTRNDGFRRVVVHHRRADTEVDAGHSDGKTSE